MKYVFRAFIIFQILQLSLTAFSQQDSIQIKIADEKTKEPLINVTVNVLGKVLYSDFEGVVSFYTEKFPIEIRLSYIGYQDKKFELYRNSENVLDVFMSSAEVWLDIVSVTGSRYEQNIAAAPVSIDVLKPDLIRSVNTVNASTVLNKLPGVQVIDGQANIRGGSGYSYGAGSRVMLLVDDIPALQMDAGFPNWSDIPVEALSQVEVLKGASSALYGSSALNGIINFRTSYATSDPETRIGVSATNFHSPSDPLKKWWKDSTFRYQTNFNFVHKQKFNKLDVVVSGFYNKLNGFLKDTEEQRGRLYLNTRYRLTERLSFGLAINTNLAEGSAYYIWKNAGSGAMQGLPGTISQRNTRRIYIDPFIQYYDTYGNRHKLIWRTSVLKNENDTDQSNSSTNHYGEYQFLKNMEQMGLSMTAGLVGMWNFTNSQILGDTTFSGLNYAAYAQLEKKLFEKWALSGGLRYEYIQQKSPANFMGIVIPNGIKSDGRIIGRLSATYNPYEFTFLRASWGQGYRFPTLTERFVTTSFGSFAIFAKPDLEPETGWSTEIGIKQGIPGFLKGFIDASFFLSEYEEMIEFTFVPPPTLGFQPQNVGSIRIAGFEGSITGQADIGKWKVNTLTGYTFIQPVYKDYNSNEDIRKSVSTDKNVLKYRSRHQLKSDVEVLYSRFKLGVSLQWVSHVVNIDRAFESVPPINFDIFGIGAYRSLNNKGYTLLDLRFAIKFYTNSELTLIVNNVMNQEYTLRPALVEAPINTTLRWDYRF